MTAPAVQEQDDPLVGIVKTMVEHHVPPAEIEAFVKQQRAKSFNPATTSHTGTPFVNATPDDSETLGDRMSGAVSAAYNGLTLGQGNKLIAALRTAMAARSGGHLNYGDELKDQDAVLDDYTRRRPVAAAALEVAGSLPTMAAELPLAGVSAGRSMLNAAKATPKIAEHLPVVGRVIRAGKTLERLGQRLAPEAAPVEATARPALRLVPKDAPTVEGLQGPMDSLDDIVRSGRVEPGPQSLEEMVNSPTLAPTRHRTKAQFEHFADMMAKRQAQASEGEPDLAEQLRQTIEATKGRRTLR